MLMAVIPGADEFNPRLVANYVVYVYHIEFNKEDMKISCRSEPETEPEIRRLR